MGCPANAPRGPSPAQLSQAPAHPAIADRLVELAQDLTLLLDTTDTFTFAPDTKPRQALDALIASAIGLAGRADAQTVNLAPRS